MIDSTKTNKQTNSSLQQGFKRQKNLSVVSLKIFNTVSIVRRLTTHLSQTNAKSKKTHTHISTAGRLILNTKPVLYQPVFFAGRSSQAPHTNLLFTYIYMHTRIYMSIYIYIYPSLYCLWPIRAHKAAATVLASTKTKNSENKTKSIKNSLPCQQISDCTQLAQA